MAFQLASINSTDIKQLSTKLQEEISFIRENTENFDTLYFEVFEDNDSRLFQLAQAELAQLKKPKPDKTKPSVQQTTEKVTPKLQATKEQVSVKAAKKEVPKATSKAETKSAENPTYSWKRKVPADLLEAAKTVQLDCTFRAIPAEKDGKVEVKTTFNKGDYLLVHEDGYPFAVMKADSFKKRCITPKKAATSVEPKVTASKVTSKPEPKPKQPKKPATIQAILDNPPAPLLTWLDGQIELWKNRQTNKKLTKIMVINQTGEIIIEYTHYDRLLRVADLRYSYHKVCPKTTKLTKVAEPGRGKYRLLVGKAELKEQYSTNRNWQTCRAWMKEAYQCARAGNCSAEQKDLYSKYYHQCGDQIAKEEDVAYLRWLHQQAGENWKRGEESYLVAFERVVRKLKE